MSRPLVIDDAAEAEAARIIAYAMDHIYRPGAGVPPPGDDPNLATTLNTYRVVFSFTEMGGVTFRHLSVSVPSKKLPNPYAVFAIAELFGFTGYDAARHYMARLPEGWVVDVHDDENCVVVAQKLVGGAR